MISVLKKSIFKNLIVLVHGPIILLSSNSNDLTFKDLENINVLIDLLGLKLNNNVYSKNQIKKMKKLAYTENILFFYNSIKAFTKVPYYQLKNQNARILSK
jgi:hypothetical protein